MTETPCFEPDQLQAISEQPADSEQRRHARECPRCSALLTEYTLYLSMRDPAPGADPDDATRRLSAFLRREIGAPPASAPTAERPSVAHTLGTSPARSESWLDRLFAPAWRPALAFAVVALAAAAVLLVPRMKPHEGGEQLRGSTSGTGPRVELVQVDRDVAGARLSWHAFAGADGYQVRFFTRDLREVARIAVGPDTVRTFDTTELPGDRGAPLVIRVVALAGGDELSSSVARPLEVAH